LQKGVLNKVESTIDISDLADGVYFLLIQNEQQKTFNCKLLKFAK
jgi:hypothetical protein